jgi:two-component system NtrC family response regulator
MMTVLVVDDEPNYLWMIDELLKGEGFEVVICPRGCDALQALKESNIDVLLTDLRMAEMDGMAVLEGAREISPATSTVLMTAYGTIERATEAMKRGAYDFIVKPFHNADLIRALRQAGERSSLIRQNVRLSQSLADRYQPQRLIGISGAMKAVVGKVNRVVDSKSAVLITGESGVGKELVARAIHFSGPRRGQTFLAVNCGGLTDSLAESELFGHEKGAFTGAHSRHVGLFEQAHEGTLFLDEIGELPLPLQAKLLRALDQHEIRRVGSERAIRVDLRILSATHRDLKAEVAAGRFREDLFFRLSVVRIEIPPLRERSEDIPLLAETFLHEFVRSGEAKGRNLSPAARELLMAYRWPGNVRELHNVMAHAALMAAGEEIQAADLPIELASGQDWQSALDRVLPADAPLESTLRAIEERMIARALAKANGVQARAAEALRISRSLLQYKIKRRQDLA